MKKPTTTESHNAAAAGNPISTKEPPRLLTRKQMEDLEKQLSEPALVHELTPQGSVVREVRTEHDRKIIAQIGEIRERLEKRRNQARDSFNQAHDGWKGGGLKR